MKSKTVLTAVLLLFVNLVAERIASGKIAGANDAPVAVVAYCFHNYQRCETCLRIEASALGALKDGFSSELARGGLVWRTVNMEDPRTEHFIEDFKLASGGVVLADYREGTLGAWKNLEQVWDLSSDEAALREYVTAETRAFLGN